MNIFGGLGLGQGGTVQLEFKRDDGTPIKTATVKAGGAETETLPLFTNKDTITGEVKVANIPGKKLEHQGVKVQLIGQIELATERGHPHDFVNLVRDLAPPGEVTSPQTLPFEFANVEMQYDSYRGLQVRLRYLLRVTVTRGYGGSISKDFFFWVRNYSPPPPPNNLPPIKMEVGIEDCLHIEFEYDKSKYHLKDTVVGKIYFLLVRIKLKHMEIEIRRRETTGTGSSARNESETLAKYEIMDGAPVRGENIPIRLFLSPYDLTPTYKLVHNKFSVKYYLNLVLVDEEDRRYFKQQEIQLLRLAEPAAGADDATAAGSGPKVAPAPARLITPPRSPGP
ncbi:g2286 [Coccomyxa elongata]